MLEEALQMLLLVLDVLVKLTLPDHNAVGSNAIAELEEVLMAAQINS